MQVLHGNDNKAVPAAWRGWSATTIVSTQGCVTGVSRQQTQPACSCPALLVCVCGAPQGRQPRRQPRHDTSLTASCAFGCCASAAQKKMKRHQDPAQSQRLCVMPTPPTLFRQQQQVPPNIDTKKLCRRTTIMVNTWRAASQCDSGAMAAARCSSAAAQTRRGLLTCSQRCTSKA